jgi:hypothetical protein
VDGRRRLGALAGGTWRASRGCMLAALGFQTCVKAVQSGWPTAGGVRQAVTRAGSAGGRGGEGRGRSKAKSRAERAVFTRVIGEKGEARGGQAASVRYRGAGSTAWAAKGMGGTLRQGRGIGVADLGKKEEQFPWQAGPGRQRLKGERRVRAGWSVEGGRPAIGPAFPGRAGPGWCAGWWACGPVQASCVGVSRPAGWASARRLAGWSTGPSGFGSWAELGRLRLGFVRRSAG